MGRPSSYDEAQGKAICERLANGESLRNICKDDDMPVQSTVFKWIADIDSFSKQYASARVAQMEAMAEDILAIADDSSGDAIEIDLGDNVTVTKQNGEFMQRSRLRVDTRKWLMSKMAPKKYGDKVEQFISGPEGGPIQSAITVQFVKTGAE